MFPILFQYKFITIGSYGIMLGIAVYTGFLLGEREFILKNKDPELAYKILIFGIPVGLIGAKLFHVFEHMDTFLRDPWEMLTSGSGLSVYGSLLLPLIASYFIIKKNKEKFLEIMDLAAPALALAYAIGRIGCHAAGDGCYGVVTSSFLGTYYPNGIVPISLPVFPTPLIESLVSLCFFGILLNLRKTPRPIGQIFFLYILLNGLSRFLIEFIRRNPRPILGLSHAQLIALGLIFTGAIGIYRVTLSKFKNLKV